MSPPISSSPLLPLRNFPASRLLWRTGALMASVGIIAAHGLKKRPGITDDSLHAWGTASNYAAKDVWPCNAIGWDSHDCGIYLIGAVK
ncbi:hypothetical protein H0H93_004219 [Arthromyces matolae]|nr:hypothetical protein H0H93_004219 [Arthromyces matolae]